MNSDTGWFASKASIEAAGAFIPAQSFDYMVTLYYKKILSTFGLPYSTIKNCVYIYKTKLKTFNGLTRFDELVLYLAKIEMIRVTPSIRKGQGFGNMRPACGTTATLCSTPLAALVRRQGNFFRHNKL